MYTHTYITLHYITLQVVVLTSRVVGLLKSYQTRNSNTKCSIQIINYLLY